FRVQICDQVEPSMPPGMGVVVEVDVGVELLSPHVLVRSTANVVRVVEEPIDPTDGTDEVEKGLSLKDLVRALVRASQISDDRVDRLTSQRPELTARVPRSKRGKLREQPFAERLIEEAVDHDVRKRVSGSERLCERVFRLENCLRDDVE